MKYWVGTMNRVAVTEDNEYPIKADKWEQHKDEWREVTPAEYKKAWAAAWDIACNTIWHC